MNSSFQNTAHLESLIEKNSATLAIIRLKIAGLNSVDAEPGQINRLRQFEQAHKTYISYLENELEQLQLVQNIWRDQSEAGYSETLIETVLKESC